MINQIYRGYTKTCERFYDTHTRKINKASFSHKRVTALLSLIFWSCFCLLHFSLTFPLPRRKLSPFQKTKKHYKFWWSWLYGNAEKKKKKTDRSLYLALLSMHWKTSYHDWIFICNLRIKISNPCYAQPYLLFRANLLQRIEFSVNFAWPWVVVTASPTKLGTLESGRVSCNEF